MIWHEDQFYAILEGMVRILCLLATLLAPSHVFAQEHRTIVLTTGIRISFASALDNLVTFLAVSAGAVAICVFLIGAFYVVSSSVHAEGMETGKKMMKNSLMGLAIILGSFAILRTVFYLLNTGLTGIG